MIMHSVLNRLSLPLIIASLSIVGVGCSRTGGDHSVAEHYVVQDLAAKDIRIESMWFEVGVLSQQPPMLENVVISMDLDEGRRMVIFVPSEGTPFVTMGAKDTLPASLARDTAEALSVSPVR